MSIRTGRQGYDRVPLDDPSDNTNNTSATGNTGSSSSINDGMNGSSDALAGVRRRKVVDTLNVIMHATVWTVISAFIWIYSDFWRVIKEDDRVIRYCTQQLYMVVID
jgi:hypothetical protein